MSRRCRPFIPAMGLIFASGCFAGHVADGGSSDAGSGGAQSGGNVVAFKPLAAEIYVAKVKNLLTGLPASTDEVSQVTMDPNALRTLVSAWMVTPQYQTRMTEFFTTAFQQDNVSLDNIQNTMFCFAFVPGEQRIVANVRESFGRTAMELVNEGLPFTATMTTTRFMMTPPMMMLMAFSDQHYCYNNGFAGDAAAAEPNFHLTFTPNPVPLADSANPNSPNYLSFTSPQLQAATGTCAQPNGITFGSSLGGIFGMTAMPSVMLGFLWGGAYNANGCNYPKSGTGPVNDADWGNWHMVNVRAPQTGEKTTRFFDIATMRSTSELVLQTPRVGFYTTMAFQTTWGTNSSNQFRLTMNQTLITGLGHAFDGTDSIAPQSLAALDANHAAPGTACYACHLTLDPMRQYFNQQYDYAFSPLNSSVPGQFAFDGVSVVGQGIADLGAQMAAHPRFALAWTQKLCTWANAGVCDATDPEFIRLQNAFVSSNYNFNTLVLELFTSPILTMRAPTVTTTNTGGNFSVSKQNILCDMLSERLKVNDICSLNPATLTPANLAPVATIATVLPVDTYGRGSVAPNQANQPGLFYRASLENLCVAVSSVAVDGSAGVYKSADPNGAIADMVHSLMDVTPPRDTTPLSILTGHYNASLAAGLAPSDALKSTFVLACLSPTVAGVGQ